MTPAAYDEAIRIAAERGMHWLTYLRMSTCC